MVGLSERHRRCQQIPQAFTTAHGYDDVPPALREAGFEPTYRAVMNAAKRDIEQLHKTHHEAAVYAIPFGFKVRCRERPLVLPRCGLPDEATAHAALSVPGRVDSDNPAGFWKTA